MNEEQKRLYDEWQSLESAIAIEVKIVKKGEPYGQVKSIKMEDVKKIKPIRKQVWDKLKNFLSPNEKFDLGTRLNKTTKEIFQSEWPPKNWKQNKILAKGAIFRAKSGLLFLDECLIHIHKGSTDVVFSRSLYILFSYNFELILKACILLASKQTEREDLIKEIKSHNLEELSKKLLQDTLNGLGIRHVRQEKSLGFTKYVIKMIKGNDIVVQDLIDIRYDFEKDLLRNIDPNESGRMKEEVEIMLGITRKIMKEVED